MKRQGRIRYPEFINECAFYAGKLRNLYNYELNTKTDKYNRYGQSDDPDILGIKGELIFSYFLSKNDIEYTSTKLLSNKPLKEPDIIIGNSTIDIKTIRKESPHFLVNEEAHKKDKGINMYVFVQIQDNNTADYWIFDYEEVNSWEVKFFKYTNAYSKLISDMNNG